MMDNHTYNLAQQLVQENKTLWRINNHYLEDAEGCDKCKALWEKLKGLKEESMREMTELLKEHLS
jgi:hypothetical protein